MVEKREFSRDGAADPRDGWIGEEDEERSTRILKQVKPGESRESDAGLEVLVIIRLHCRLMKPRARCVGAGPVLTGKSGGSERTSSIS